MVVPLPLTHFALLSRRAGAAREVGTLIVPRASAGLETEGLTGVLDGLFCG